MAIPQDKLFAAMLEEEFHRRMDDDEILAALEAEKFNPALEYWTLLTTIGAVYSLNGLALQPLTPAAWSFLWCTGNGYTRRGKPIEAIDSDVFLYLLHHGCGDLGGDIDDLFRSASGFCEKHGMKHEEVSKEIYRIISIAFRPLGMLPPSGRDDEARYDADWLTGLVAAIAPVVNLPPDRIMFELSMAACCGYYVQAVRHNDPRAVVMKKSESEVARAIWLRTVEIGEHYYNETRGENGD